MGAQDGALATDALSTTLDAADSALLCLATLARLTAGGATIVPEPANRALVAAGLLSALAVRGRHSSLAAVPAASLLTDQPLDPAETP